jgi:hypothetical protein
LCDGYGNVTGIVDGEGATARPHRLGWAALPLWLRRDLETLYNWPWDRSTTPPFEIQKYRHVYVAELNKLVPRPEKEKSIYQPMSHLTCSLYYACKHPMGDPELWCDRFLHMALPSLSPEKFFSHLGGKGCIKVVDREYEETTKLDEWLELNILRWYLRYGNIYAHLELMGYFDWPKPDNDVSSESSDSDVESVAENDSGNHNESAVMIHPASEGMPGTPCTTTTTCSPSSHDSTADKPDCEVSNKSVSGIPDLHAVRVVTNEATEELITSEQTTTIGSRSCDL